MYLDPETLKLVQARGPVDLGGHRSIRRLDLGRLCLPSGRVAAVDSVWPFEAQPFTVSVAPGDYPAAAFIMENSVSGLARVALAALYFSGRPAESWRPALLPGQGEAELLERAYFGYYVDSATGSFMSAETAAWLNRAPLDHELLGRARAVPAEGEALPGRLWRELAAQAIAPNCAAVNFFFDPPRGLNAVIFTSGAGNGCYPSFFGYDASGNPCCLVTDFLLDCLEETAC